MNNIEAFVVKIIFKDGNYDFLSVVNENGEFFMKPTFKMFKQIPEEFYNSIFNGHELSQERDNHLNKIITSDLTYDEFFDVSWNPYPVVSLQKHNQLTADYFQNYLKN